eukprot:CAMPEP_0202073662 /NCGR_PEP_ID=MMETSP0964-20121228/3168_1 /ASSEMBLY_ACC=CAM_ASM_000500 /TAXON_ID=4773 /ORGANISM="Schizochytrium aggregatum, Strain ATCC28209" /LENGTH=266 /DNA_ID=CAMNT_0048640775 /DNA_START=1 /DNA_END=801 /DNA_ORIENTATION=+
MMKPRRDEAAVTALLRRGPRTVAEREAAEAARELADQSAVAVRGQEARRRAKTPLRPATRGIIAPLPSTLRRTELLRDVFPSGFGVRTNPSRRDLTANLLESKIGLGTQCSQFSFAALGELPPEGADEPQLCRKVSRRRPRSRRQAARLGSTIKTTGCAAISPASPPASLQDAGAELHCNRLEIVFQARPPPASSEPVELRKGAFVYSLDSLRRLFGAGSGPLEWLHPKLLEWQSLTIEDDWLDAIEASVRSSSSQIFVRNRLRAQ